MDVLLNDPLYHYEDQIYQCRCNSRLLTRSTIITCPNLKRRTVNSSLQTLKQATIELTNAENNYFNAFFLEISQSINTGHVH
ncbi:hypothetical protein T4B_2543 [Trichinella pseudospiralis]|uniref:Uncharacterized protein n=1 Tax=Trichinella pseudospiralis TaxID=6337 RepID=A0A0V1ERI6_TRIPS|nr:hypothetical protein T4A_12317 [Trichinella pseudospiralis]KRZ32240.1 hypothetical protein T4B_2543 [Trichinella pseudospiralis]KRZ38961.1 hypothetical protein T4C_9520 [Trichinella pseudospiralis]